MYAIFSVSVEVSCVDIPRGERSDWSGGVRGPEIGVIDIGEVLPLRKIVGPYAAEASYRAPEVDAVRR